LTPKVSTPEQVISKQPVVCHGVTVDRAAVEIISKPYGDLLQINLDSHITGPAGTIASAAQISGNRDCDNRENVSPLCIENKCGSSSFPGFAVLFDDSCPLENHELLHSCRHRQTRIVMRGPTIRSSGQILAPSLRFAAKLNP